MVKKISCVLLAVLLCCLPLSVGAASGTENEVQPLFNYTNYTSVSMGLSNGTAECYASLTGYSDLCTRIEVTMTLQKKTLFWWSKVQTWTYSVNDYYIDMYRTASIGSGTYRVKAEFVAYNGSASETITSYSQQDSI